MSVIFILSGWVMNLSFKTFGPLDATSPVAIEVMAFEQKKCCLNRQLWDFLVQWNVPQLFGCNQLKQNNPVCCKHNNIYISDLGGCNFQRSLISKMIVQSSHKIPKGLGDCTFDCCTSKQPHAITVRELRRSQKRCLFGNCVGLKLKIQ